MLWSQRFKVSGHIDTRHVSPDPGLLGLLDHFVLIMWLQCIELECRPESGRKWVTGGVGLELWCALFWCECSIQEENAEIKHCVVVWMGSAAQLFTEALFWVKTALTWIDMSLCTLLAVLPLSFVNKSPLYCCHTRLPWRAQHISHTDLKCDLCHRDVIYRNL